MAAMIINIIMNAEKTVIKTLIHSWSIISSVLVLLKLLIVVLEFEKVTAVTNSFIVRIFSLLNDEEDDNLGDNVWDDMFACVCQVLIFLHSLSFFLFFPSFFPSFFHVTIESTRDDEKQIKSQQFFIYFWCKNKAFMLCIYDGMLKAEACRKILLLILIELCL